MTLKKRALHYHSSGRKGKVEVIPTKSVETQEDLSLAYTPGVAAPCLEIAENPDTVFDYTAKGNLVAVITNGTSVLGLGNIGPMAAKPVMEGKGILFKKLADIDVFDIELNAPTAKEVIDTCRALEPTFGGINLEDIKAPDCFEVERALQETLNIPVFHDDQHGTAIICGAAFLNAMEITGRKPETTKVVFSGGGAAAIACARIFQDIGIPKENMLMFDTKGLIYKGRKEGMNSYKEQFAADPEKVSARTLKEGLIGADAFVGVSVANALPADFLVGMNKNPLVFAMANPDPEILPEDAKKVRPDVIMATGRSDYPNQVNNVLGFPFIFRGALDVRARHITESMKVAAMKALASLAKQPVPESVQKAYGGIKIEFGPEYLIPKPIDPRVLLWVAPAVAQAAALDNVARQPIKDFEAYIRALEKLRPLPSDALTSHREVQHQIQELRSVE